MNAAANPFAPCNATASDRAAQKQCEKMLLACELLGAGGGSFKVDDLQRMLALDGADTAVDDLAAALGMLVAEGLLRRIGNGAFVLRGDFTSPTPAQLMAGNATVSRRPSVPLEHSLWPEDAPARREIEVITESPPCGNFAFPISREARLQPHDVRDLIGFMPRSDVE